MNVTVSGRHRQLYVRRKYFCTSKARTIKSSTFVPVKQTDYGESEIVCSPLGLLTFTKIYWHYGILTFTESTDTSGLLTFTEIYCHFTPSSYSLCTYRFTYCNNNTRHSLDPLLILEDTPSHTVSLNTHTLRDGNTLFR